MRVVRRWTHASVAGALALNSIMCARAAGSQNPAAAPVLVVRDAQISPDGRSIAFARGALQRDAGAAAPMQIWLVPFAGGEPRALTSDDSEQWHPRWSPDGSTIAFLSRRSGGFSRLQLMAASGGLPRTLSDEPVHVVAFAWSPKERRIAYVVAATADATTGRIRVADVTTGRTDTLPAIDTDVSAHFSWAGTGTALAVLATQAGVPRTRLLVVPLAGSSRELASAAAIKEVAWSPEGETIAWLTAADPDSEPSGLLVIPSDGGSARPLLAPGEGLPLYIAWTNQQRLSIALARDATTIVDVLDLQTGARTTVLPPGLARLTSAPSWSADGTRFTIAGSAAEHEAEVFAGSLPLPLPPGRDFVGMPPPPVRRITFSNPNRAIRAERRPFDSLPLAQDRQDSSHPRHRRGAAKIEDRQIEDRQDRGSTLVVTERLL